jgi:hypothetical protein
MENFMFVRVRFTLSWILLASLLLSISCTLGQTESTIVPALIRMELMPVQPRPSFIDDISPPEYAVVPQNIYDRRLENTQVNAMGTIEDGFRASICIDLNLEPLVQQGDDFSRSDIGSERVALFANGLPMELSTERLSKSVLIMDDTEKPIEEWTLYPAGVEMICWKAPLNVGIHEALFTFKQTSGDIQEYTWYFEIR